MNPTTTTACTGALLAGMLAACSTAAPPRNAPPTAIQGTAERYINLDAQGRPLSVVVRLYQLRDHVDFSTLTFEALASGRPEESLLGPQLIRKQEWIAVPASDFANPLTLDPETRYVAVAALFRHPDAQYWRYLVAADALRSAGTLKLHVGPCYLVVQAPKPLQMPGQSPGASPSCNQGMPPSRLPGSRAERQGPLPPTGPLRPQVAPGAVGMGAAPPPVGPNAIADFAASVGSAKALPAPAIQQEAPSAVQKWWGRASPSAAH